MVKIGIIGYGYWGPNLVRNFNEIEACAIKTLCDKKASKLKELSKKYPAIKTTQDYKDILNDKEIDAVVIATPVSTHYSLAKEALMNGKHVFIEKPIAKSSAEAQELISLADKKKKKILVGHTFLYSPSVMKVKELLDKKEIGDIYYINSSRVNLGLFQPDVSVLWDLGPHDLSIILYWLNDRPVEVYATGSSYIQKNIEEVTFLTLKFKSGIMAHIHMSWLAPAKLRRTTIIGSEKMVIYDDTESVEKVKIYDQGVVKNPEDFGQFQLTYRAGDVISPHIDIVEPLRSECMDFINAIRNNTEPKSDARFGLEVVKIIEAAQQSMQSRGTAVKIN
jgi:predicted dehydrogenase